MSDLYRIDWKKLTEGLDDKELLFIEGCVREATIDKEKGQRELERQFDSHPQVVDFAVAFDAAVEEETP